MNYKITPPKETDRACCFMFDEKPYDAIPVALQHRLQNIPGMMSATVLTSMVVFGRKTDATWEDLLPQVKVLLEEEGIVERK